jgi:uncharacterized protein (TIGR02453 family)
VTTERSRSRGIPAAAFAFYDGLRADNSRSYWQAHRDSYLTDVRAPVDQVLAELDAYGPFHVFRPYQDARFAKGRPPYKEHLGAYGESDGGAGFYLQVSADGLMAAAGYYAMAADQLDRFRRAVDADATGAEIAGIVAALEQRGHSIGAIAELKTAPRGYPKDHPRIELLRRKGLMASVQWPVSSWMHTKAAITKVRAAWEACADMNAWLDAHVGPSTLAPEDAERF